MRRRRWLRGVLAVAVLLLSASWGLSHALHDGWAHRSLLASLTASFGRPVEVGYFDFSLLSGARLEAHSVTVSEDPRFGSEYFLRAERLTASPRWGKLLRGRLELGALSFSGASLNVVRAADGHWNIESWLPPAKKAPPEADGSALEPAATSSQGVLPAVRFEHINIDRGRINFKRGEEKLPFALVDVSGRLVQDGNGRWGIDLEAHPMRASVALQEAGTLRLRGAVAGTSARLQPAALALSWEQASLADAIRLAHGTDYGVRGRLEAEFSAAIQDSSGPDGIQSASSGWTIAGVIRLADLHRWDLVTRPTNPAINVSVTAAWAPDKQQLELIRCIVEAPHSRVTASGEMDWSHGWSPSLRLEDSRIGWEDLLAWRRAFLPDVAAGLAMEGTFALEATLAGWPLRIEEVALDSPGAVVRATTLAAPIHLGRIQTRFERGSLRLQPVEVLLPSAPATAESRSVGETPAPPSGVLRLEGLLGPFRPGDPPSEWNYRLTLSGETARAQDLVAVAAAFGGPASAEWMVEGPAALQLAWTGTLRRGTSRLHGTLQLDGLQLSSVLMNQPLLVTSASVDLRPDVTRVRLDSAEALGAHWKGSLEWRAEKEAWDFDLSADRLDAAELNRWLGPRARPSFLRRMLPFAGSSRAASAREAALANFQAHGRLRVAELTINPLRVVSLDAQAQLVGRDLVLRRVQGEFYGGRVTGEFEARLSGAPTYAFRGHIARTNLAALAAATAPLAGRFAGLASGELTLAARGIERKDLLASLEGGGTLDVRDAVIRGPDLLSEFEDVVSEPQAGSEGYFGGATGSFRVVGGSVHLEQFLFAGHDEQFEVVGKVDFTRRLDLRIQSIRSADGGVAGTGIGVGGDAWVVGGTMEAPQVTRQTRIARDGTDSAALRLQ